jgi:hypothetical protein
MTQDMWHVSRETQGGEVFSFYGLEIKVFW